MTTISMIAAMANNRIIGKDNEMPWHMPADLKHFKSVTMGKPVVMGRKTFESIGRPLPGRQNLVITRNDSWQKEGVTVVQSPEEALSVLSDADEIMIIGGGNIYKQFLSKADLLYLTLIDLDVEGDTQFPDWAETAKWELEASEEHTADAQNPNSYKFIKLRKIN